MTTSLPAVWTTVLYRDPDAARSFLTSAFGFAERSVYVEEGRLVHAELIWEGAAGTTPGGVMFGPLEPGCDTEKGGDEKRIGASSAHVVVDDPDALFARAVAAGATVVRELEDTDYGSRQCILADPEGNTWSFGTWYE
jgi:uncharacterized glyoxalase superfamily protein PhnB